MAIQFRDFLPRETGSGMFVTRYAPIQDTVTRASEWIAADGIDVINVETVLMPSIGDTRDSTGTVRTGAGVNDWYQVVRVWYRPATP